MKLALVWIVVIIPLSWGVYESIKKSMPLFVGAKAADPAKK